MRLRSALAAAALAAVAGTSGCLPFSCDLGGEDDVAAFVFGAIARQAFLAMPPAKVPKQVKRTETYAYIWADYGETNPTDLTIHIGRTFGDPQEKQIGFRLVPKGTKKVAGKETNSADLLAAMQQILGEMTDAQVVVTKAKLVAAGKQVVEGEDWKVSLAVVFSGTADGQRFTGRMRIAGHANGFAFGG